MTLEEVQTLWDYNPDTGDFTWKARSNNAAFNTNFAGKRAGYKTQYGSVARAHVYIKLPAAHNPIPVRRIIWLLQTGDWIPARYIKYRDGDCSNLRWDNLYFAPAQCNTPIQRKRPQIPAHDLLTGTFLPKHLRSGT